MRCSNQTFLSEQRNLLTCLRNCEMGKLEAKAPFMLQLVLARFCRSLLLAYVVAEQFEVSLSGLVAVGVTASALTLELDPKTS
ncbi:hypothetical protein RJT34_06728 [Clitoria ternatea]|uniref:Uncharacterized protein n=1 Tax=Clitoria ternatea TaxID=43366 RepID=A0AAN9PTP7_CLITE